MLEGKPETTAHPLPFQWILTPTPTAQTSLPPVPETAPQILRGPRRRRRPAAPVPVQRRPRRAHRPDVGGGGPPDVMQPRLGGDLRWRPGATVPVKGDAVHVDEASRRIGPRADGPSVRRPVRPDVGQAGRRRIVGEQLVDAPGTHHRPGAGGGSRERAGGARFAAGRGRAGAAGTVGPCAPVRGSGRAGRQWVTAARARARGAGAAASGGRTTRAAALAGRSSRGRAGSRAEQHRQRHAPRTAQPTHSTVERGASGGSYKLVLVPEAADTTKVGREYGVSLIAPRAGRPSRGGR